MPRGGLKGGQAHLLCRRPPEPVVGKESLPMAFPGRRQKSLCRWPFQAVGKEIFFWFFFLPIFFLGASYTKYNPPLKVRTILSFLAIFR
jgi:hypothetical protein